MIGPLHTENYPVWAKNTTDIKNWDKIIAWSKFHTIADFEYFNWFYDKVHNAIDKKVNNQKMLNHAKSALNWYDFDPELYLKIIMFNHILFNEFPIQNENPITRKEIYENDNSPLLSEIYENWKQQCVEYSILAQKFLQDINIKSSIFYWEVLWSLENKEDLDKQDIYWEAHTYIILEIKEKTYIYDPTNPINNYPRILEVPWNFYEQVKEPMMSWSKALLKSKDIAFGTESYYWTWTWSSIYPMNIIENEHPWKITRVFDKETSKLLFEIKYDLIHKWLWDKKASNMYSWINDVELLEKETFEVEIKNVTEIVDLLLKNKWDNIEYNNHEELLHTHEMNDYRIMCYDELLEDKNKAINTFKTWILLTSWLIYLKDFSEANTYIEDNPESWYKNLNDKFTIRI